MKKIVINSCFGGFSLSPHAVKRLAELQGRECYFFKQENIHNYTLTDVEGIGESFMWSAFDTKDLSFLGGSKEWHKMDLDERKAHNDTYAAHHLSSRGIERDNPLLIQVIEELGGKANGSGSKLKIVEIPDDVDWTIEEYDGNEHIAEKHQTWD